MIHLGDQADDPPLTEKRSLNLSKYFPKDTEYFYSFPAGQESNFFNSDPAWKEELITARPLACAGPDVRVITFAETLKESAWKILKHDLQASVISEKQIITLPEGITANVTGRRRNYMIKKALEQIATQGKLVMAQPFLDRELERYFQIPPDLSVWFNDKKNLPAYIPTAHLPERYASFDNGKNFSEDGQNFPFPCVVKVSSSASGDGVRICRTSEDLSKAKKEFIRIRGTIIVEEYIQSAYNVGIQFGIPSNASQPIEIIGINEQLTTAYGEYLGAVVNFHEKIPFVDMIYHVMLSTILPYVRRSGWYGVGDLDVLIREDGHFYFIDCNFRMTAMTAYLYQIRNGDIRNSIATFTGTFAGAVADFRGKILPIAQHGTEKQRIHIMTLTAHNDGLHFNAGMLFEGRRGIASAAFSLSRLGIRSVALKRLRRYLNTKETHTL